MAKYDIFTTLLMNNSPYVKGLNQAKKSSEDFGRGVQTVSTGIKSAFAGMLAVAGGGITVFEGIKKTIGATQLTADAFEITLAGMNTAADSFFKTLSTGDWSNFLDNLLKANEAGMIYAGIMDEISDRQRSVDLFTAQEQTKLSGFEEIFRDTSLPAATRQKALDDYKTLKTELLNAQRKINDEILSAEQNKYSTLSGLDKQYIDYVLTNYDKEIEKIRDANENIQKYTTISQASTTQSAGMYSYTVKDPDAEKKASEFYNSLSKDQQDWFNRMQAYNKLNDAELEKIKQAKLNLLSVDNEIASLNVTLIRQQNSINNATEAEAKEASKIAQSKREQAEFNRQREELKALIPLTPIDSKGIDQKDINILSPLDPVQYETDADKMIEKNQELEDSFNKLTAVNQVVGDSFLKIAEDGKITMAELTGAVMQSIMQIIIGKMAETSAFIASDSVKKWGWAGIALASVGIGLVSSLFSGIMSDAGNFADSGIVPGSSMFGDKMIAHVNSREMILSTGDQTRLFDMIKTGSGGGVVEFQLRGDRLEGAVSHSRRVRRSYQGSFSNRR